MISILKEYLKKIETVPLNKNKNPIKLSIIGEIYTVIEPYSNLNIEDKLMDYGVSTKRHLTPSWWYRDMVLKPLKLNSLNLRRASKRYLPLYIGGHGRECIGEAVLAGNEGMDGQYDSLLLPKCTNHIRNPRVTNFPIWRQVTMTASR